MDQQMTGGCACGRVRYTATIHDPDAYLCHCRICQRATGTMWNCLMKPTASANGASPAGKVNVDCGEHKTGGSPVRPKTQIGMWAARQHGWDAGYDGYYWFPLVHGSPPLAIAGRQQVTGDK